MPQRITIQMYAPTQMYYWTNRYWTTDAVASAGDTLDALVAAHRLVLRSDFYVHSARIDDGVPNTDNFDTVTYNLAGTVTGDLATTLPFYNTARVDFDVAGGGRPSRKYLRGLLIENDISFVTLAAGAITNMNSYGDAVVAIGTICDPQGNLFVDAVPFPAPQMRQIRRGSKKPVTP